ncbi:MAG: anthranilate synthase component I [Gloeocapsa sp. UFS-A4-WI-NPMV-4B04]|jgi:para-aminobenzoate synthetase component 1|nr:anthranilate synthase component I [Gloeocapsa sp. UFS-A4-WI-NPMV-4B04]
MQPWYWRSLPLENRTGSEIFSALFRHDSTQIGTLLESPYPTPFDQTKLARYSICAGAQRIINGHSQLWTPPLGKVLPFLQQLLLQVASNESQAASDSPPDLPFTGGWLGWLGYDLAWEIERLPYLKSDLLPFPVAFWYEPECFAVLDHKDQILWLAASERTQLDTLQNQLEQSHNLPCSPAPPLPISPSPHLPTLLTSQIDYETAVHRAKKYIQAGDIFQANLSLRFEAHTTADAWAIYLALQQINPSPFASYWRTPWGTVISCSPERLVQLQNRQATTRPIAGTRRRGTTPDQDQHLVEELITNAKERAEHTMLVDLERNDLGRVCEWGSVVVDELLTIERYSHVMHLVSSIKGNLRPDCNAVDLIRAMFPGGTITGCPKVRCMSIIEELEPVRRNLFYGSCGYLDWRGNLDMNILIRTLLLASSPPDNRRSIVWGQVGAGIVADSDPEREWYESLQKAQAQLTALERARDIVR